MISLIVAMSKNRVIGKGNTIPWREPEDMKYFKATTMGKAMIMGRKTYESIGKPLPGRLSIVLTRGQRISTDENLIYVPTLEEALSTACQKGKEAIITGGADIYKLALEVVERIYLTIINREIDGDTHFPEFNQSEWNNVEARVSVVPPNDLIFKTFDRKK